MTGALSGPPERDEVAEDCALLGLEPPPRRAPPQPIWACHLPALNAFIAVSDQWRFVPRRDGARVAGLDYSAVQAGLTMAGISLTPDEWADFRVIEQAAQAALNGG